MKAAIDAYLAVTKLKSPEWATAALFKVGLAYQRFAEALIEVPVPPNMNDEEREIYRARLQEQAQPIEDRAQEAFATAVRFAHAGHIYSRWTALAAEHLARYRPAEYPTTGVPLAAPPLREAALETGGVR